MADDLQTLANLLALPRTMQMQAEERRAQRALLSQPLYPGGPPVLTPEQLETVAPQTREFPGMNTPVLGPALHGIGTVGQVLQTVSGASTAPRASSLSTILQLRREALRAGEDARKRASHEALADAVRRGAPTSELAALAAEAGIPGAALGVAVPDTERESFRVIGEARGLAGAPLEEYVNRETLQRSIQKQAALGENAARIQMQIFREKEGFERMQNVRRVQPLLTRLSGAIERQIGAGTLLERVQQAGKFAAFKLSPTTVGQALGLSAAEQQQLADDLAIIEAPEAFAGQLLKALGEDAGRLSDFDIQRIVRHLPRLGDSKVFARAKLKVIQELVDDMAGVAPVEQGARRALFDRAGRELEAIDTRAVRERLQTGTPVPLPGGSAVVEIPD